MKNMKRILCLVVILSIFLIGCVENSEHSPKAIDGLIDLRDVGVSEQLIQLSGEWKFYWNELLHPNEMKQNPDAELIGVPHVWAGYELERLELSREGYATYHLQLLLDESEVSNVKGIYIPFVYSSYQLWVNGERLASKGTVGISEQESIPQTAPQVIYFQPGEEKIDIVLQVSNFHHRSGGLDKEIVFGSAQLMSQYRDKKIGLDLFIAGSLLVMGLYHFTMYFLRKKNIALVYFGIFCLLISLRIFVLGEVFFLRVFPEFPWVLRIRLEYITFILGLPLFLLFLQALYPQELSKRIPLYSVIVGLIFVVITVLTPTIYYTWILLTNQFIAIFYIAISLSVLWRAMKRNREGAMFTLIVSLILSITIVNDFLLYSYNIKTVDMVGYGLLLFVFSQAIVLSVQFSKAFTRVEELSERQRQWQQELEGKVVERTKELNQALQDLKKASSLDDLTRISNRGYFNEVIEQEWQYAMEQGQPISFILIDIDQYKQYNDTYGHLQGDTCLKKVANIITTCHESDEIFVARYGGEEFCMLSRNTNLKDAILLGEKVCKAVEEARIIHESSFVKDVVTVSVGVATVIPTEQLEIDVLITMADTALYQAKNAGRNQVKYAG